VCSVLTLVSSFRKGKVLSSQEGVENKVVNVEGTPRI
jgi:hypothetical protein